MVILYSNYSILCFCNRGSNSSRSNGHDTTRSQFNTISFIKLDEHKIPMMSKLIALREYVKLDTMFKQTLKQMVSVCSVLLAAFFLCLCILNTSQLEFNNTILADRFLGYVPTLLMIVPIFLQQFTGSWATYLRCHKKEPF